jgi:hypothetical protein
MNSSNGGELVVHGLSGGNGTGVNNDGNIGSDGNGSTTNITGESNTGKGVDNDGDITETNGGNTTVTGFSNTGPGIDTNGDVVGNVTFNGTGNPNITGNGNYPGKPDGNVTPPTPPAPVIATHNSDSPNLATVWLGTGAALWLIGGLSDDVWSQEEPAKVTLQEGDANEWANATLEAVHVSKDQPVALVRLSTASGTVEHKLTLKDAGDGVKHFTAEGQNSSQVELSFNPTTREYFYQESGTSGGKPFKLQTHGWLKTAEVAVR